VHKATGRTGKRAKDANAVSRAFREVDHLKTDAERAAYLEALLEDGDSHVLTLGLRELAESTGGMSMLSKRTGLSREALYRTLSARGNPRLSTLSMLLRAFGLKLSVQPVSDDTKVAGTKRKNHRNARDHCY